MSNDQKSGPGDIANKKTEENDQLRDGKMSYGYNVPFTDSFPCILVTEDILAKKGAISAFYKVMVQYAVCYLITVPILTLILGQPSLLSLYVSLKSIKPEAEDKKTGMTFNIAKHTFKDPTSGNNFTLELCTFRLNKEKSIYPVERILLYIHGGTYLRGSPLGPEYVQLMKTLVRESEGTLIAVAPKLRLWQPNFSFSCFGGGCGNKMDQLFTDPWEALKYIAKKYPGKELIIAGDSAGANLTLFTALKERDCGYEHFPREKMFLVLLYPWMVENADATLPSEKKWKRNGIYIWEYHSSHYFPLFVKSAKEHRIFRTTKQIMEGIGDGNLPSTLVMPVEFDYCVDSGRRTAKVLKEAGVTTELIVIKGELHGCLSEENAAEKGTAHSIAEIIRSRMLKHSDPFAFTALVNGKVVHFTVKEDGIYFKGLNFDNLPFTSVSDFEVGGMLYLMLRRASDDAEICFKFSDSVRAREFEHLVLEGLNR